MIGISASSDPFPHFTASNALSSTAAETVLDWFESGASWRLKKANFYTQYEIDLTNCDLPGRVESVLSIDHIESMRRLLEQQLEISLRGRAKLVAHKLVSGHAIRIHNDFIEGGETCRLLIQLNRGWDVCSGGLLLLFGSDRAEDIRSAFLPKHNSVFAFLISHKSHHAVSEVIQGERYTLVYSFS